ncbi:MAG: type II secretion system F family protein [Pseudomonadota bacterium]
MVHIAPSVAFVIQLKFMMGKGHSVADAVHSLCERGDDCFHRNIQTWWAAYQSGQHGRWNHLFKTHHQKCLIEMIMIGLEGGPIYHHLESLQEDMEREFERQWKSYLESLPIRLSLPLLLLFFPAYVVLLFGPLVIQFFQEVSP